MISRYRSDRRCCISFLTAFRSFVSSSTSFHNAESPTRKSFGSFHSDNIEDIIRVDDDSYVVPSVYNDIHDLAVHEFQKMINNQPITFGRKVSQEFGLYSIDQSNWCFVNHGAFGNTISPILHEAQLWRVHSERQPLRFFDREIFPLIGHSLRKMSQLLDCSVTDLYPIQNVTTGLNLVLNSIDFHPDGQDEVVFFNLTYGSTKKMISHYANKRRFIPKLVNIAFPITKKEDILKSFQNAISPRTKLVIVDQITSNTAVMMPVNEMARLAKSSNKGIAVCVDAAHSLFAQEICLSNLDHVDYWLTNGHKWFSGAKGSAFLWISPRIQQFSPLIISHGFQASSISSVLVDRDKLLSSFAWDGCRDYIPIITSASCIDYWNRITVGDWETPRAYMRSLLDEAESLFIRKWRLNHEDFISVPELRNTLPMRLVGQTLPPLNEV
jgi:isopenicillin-N epimerase